MPMTSQYKNRSFKDIENRQVVSTEQIRIDSSLLEGGGQVLRINMSLSALLRIPIKIHSIRAKRLNPGLGHQHSTSAKLIADICEGILDPKELLYGSHLTGVTELSLWPGINNNLITEFIADIHTAGSVTLLLQTALPCVLLGRSLPSKLILKGGTNVAFSPSCDFAKYVFLPHLIKMGVNSNNVNINILKRGFFPRGGGELVVNIKPVLSLNPINMIDRGEPISIRGIVYGGGSVNIKDLKETKILVKKLLNEHFDVPIDIQYNENKRNNTKKKNKDTGDKSFYTKKERQQVYNESQDRFIGTCGIQLLIETSTGSIISGCNLVQNAKTKEIIYPNSVVNDAVKSLLENWNSGGCVDEYMMDQLIIYMALARGHSSVLCAGKTSISSMHLQTAIHFTSLLTGVNFTVTEKKTNLSKKPCKLVECDGMGYTNNWL